MKKVFLAVATIAFVFAMTSCDKKCTCKQYVNGSVVAEQEYTIDKDSNKKCSDYAGSALVGESGHETGVVCK